MSPRRGPTRKGPAPATPLEVPGHACRGCPRVPACVWHPLLSDEQLQELEADCKAARIGLDEASQRVFRRKASLDSATEYRALARSARTDAPHLAEHYYRCARAYLAKARNH